MIEWDKNYSVGWSMIDAEHKQIIGLINKAISAKGSSDNQEELRAVLREITNYSLAHFKTEEAYMEKFNYPDFQDHKREHDDFSKNTIAYCNRVIKEDYHTANEILGYLLKRWLVNHIHVVDKKYIDCFKENGLK